jgi:hypothetical protein
LPISEDPFLDEKKQTILASKINGNVSYEYAEVYFVSDFVRNSVSVRRSIAGGSSQ